MSRKYHNGYLINDRLKKPRYCKCGKILKKKNAKSCSKCSNIISNKKRLKSLRMKTKLKKKNGKTKR